MHAVRYVHLRDGQPPPSLSLPPFKAIIILEQPTNANWRGKIGSWLVRSGCLYCCTWGNACEAWHDEVDHANMLEFAEAMIADDSLVMTTWHETDSLDEALWFVGVAAEHPSAELSHTLILHVAPYAREADLLQRYRSAIEEA